MTSPERRPVRRRLLVVLPPLLGAVAAAVCLGFVVAALTSQWAEVRAEVADAEPLWLVLAVVAAGAAMAWIAACWRSAMGVLGAHPGRRRALAWYFTGEIGKYVPGAVWTVLGRAELARRGGVPADRAYTSVGLSLTALYLAALGVAAALVPFDLAGQTGSRSALALLALLPLGLAALHPAVLGRVRDLVVRLTGRGADVAIPRWSATARLVATYVPAWLGIWAATWCTARAFLSDPPLLRIGIATTLSWTAGFVAVPVPAGAGVREAVFVASSGLPAGIGATIAVASRLAFLLVDVVGLAVTAPWHRRRPAPAPAATASPAP